MADVQLRVSSLTAKRAHYPIARYLSYALHLLLVTPLNFHNYPRADYVFENAIGQKITAFRPRQATSWIGKLINGDSSGGGSGKSISSILMILRLIVFKFIFVSRGEGYMEYDSFQGGGWREESEEKVWRIWNVVYKYLNRTESGSNTSVLREISCETLLKYYIEKF